MGLRLAYSKGQTPISEEEEAGQYRLTNKNIGVDYYKIRQELRVLLDDCIVWNKENVYAPDEMAIRFKHLLVSIHLYPNGNGCRSRLVADILTEAMGNKPFAWGSQRIAKDKSRSMYIDALRLADQGDYDALIAFARQ
ncbi:MAG: mobile mystery protein B [Bacteroidota bacterium]